MARAIALRGFGCAAGAERLGEAGNGAECDQSVTVRETGGREKEPETEQVHWREKNKSAGRPMQEKKCANLRSS
jgi:hypothetical protein